MVVVLDGRLSANTNLIRSLYMPDIFFQYYVNRLAALQTSPCRLVCHKGETELIDTVTSAMAAHMHNNNNNTWGVMIINKIPLNLKIMGY